MVAPEKRWHYLDLEKGGWVGPVTLSELDVLRREGKVEEFTHVIPTDQVMRQGAMASGIPYSMISRTDVVFNPSAEDFYATRTEKSITVLSGPNNGGKTFLLKHLLLLVGHGGYLIACSRFSHVDILNSRKIDEHEHRRYYDNFSHSFQMAQQNTENNELQLEQVITSLKDRQLAKLFKACKDLLGNDLTLKRPDPERTFSPFYVDMDGENLRYGSSGTRLLLTLLGILLDERFSVILIDEPALCARMSETVPPPDITEEGETG